MLHKDKKRLSLVDIKLRKLENKDKGFKVSQRRLD